MSQLYDDIDIYSHKWERKSADTKLLKKLSIREGVFPSTISEKTLIHWWGSFLDWPRIRDCSIDKLYPAAKSTQLEKSNANTLIRRRIY